MRIPEYNKVVPAPGPAISSAPSAEVAAAPWRALESVGAKTADVAFEIQERQDNIFRAQEIGNRTVAAEKRIAELMTSIESDRDARGAAQRFSDEFTGIRNEIMDGIEDQRVAQSMTSYLSQREVEGTTKTRHLAWQWTVENDQSDTLKNVDDLLGVATAPGASEEDFYNSMELAIDRISVGEANGTFTPLVAEDLRKKTGKRFISQYYATLIDANPQEALDKRYLLRDLEPLDQDALYHRAIVARDRQEVRENKLDDDRFKKNAATAAIRIRKGVLGQDEVNALYDSGDIGPGELTYLNGVLDSATAKRDVENTKTSLYAMHSILNEVHIGRLDPQAAAKRIYGHSSILPSEKDQALAMLSSIRNASDKLPGTITRAVELYRTTVFPSSFSMNPRQEEAEAFGSVMREFWTDYFANEQKYQGDPNLIIKRAIERTTPKLDVSNSDPSPYKDLEELSRAYQMYVVDAKARGGTPTGRQRWEMWFKQKGGVMPKWPE